MSFPIVHLGQHNGHSILSAAAPATLLYDPEIQGPNCLCSGILHQLLEKGLQHFHIQHTCAPDLLAKLEHGSHTLTG